MRPYLLVLLLLVPLCSGQKFSIQCYGHDHLLVNNMVLSCNSEVQQACYTRVSGEKGCTPLENCSRPGWNCCKGNLCNN